MSGSTDARATHGGGLRDLDATTLRRLLVMHFRDLGWWVEPIDAGDPGIAAELRLKRDHEVVLLQCRHWGTCDRPADAVAAMIRLVDGQRVARAIIVDDTPFSVDDVADAARDGRIRLIDAQALHALIGDMPADVDAGGTDASTAVAGMSGARESSRSDSPRQWQWRWWLIAIACLTAFVLLILVLLERTADTVPPLGSAGVPAAASGHREG